MKKRLAALVATLILIALGVMLFAAFESYVLNIRAHVETALDVNPHGTWNLGTVYPEEDFFTKTFVKLSTSAQADPNLLGVSYAASCHSKPIGNTAVVVVALANACPFITFDNQAVARTFVCTADSAGVVPDPCQLGTFSLDHSANQQGWGIDFHVPDCHNAHQKDPGVPEIACPLDVSADFNIRVLGITRIVPPIVDKNGNSIAPIAHPPELNQFKGKASLAAGQTSASQVRLEFGKSVQVQAVNRVTVVAKGCPGPVTNTLFSSHLKGANPNDPLGLHDHEVWIVNMGSSCIRNGAQILIGVDMNSGGTPVAPFPLELKVESLLDSSVPANVVGTVIFH